MTYLRLYGYGLRACVCVWGMGTRRVFDGPVHLGHGFGSNGASSHGVGGVHDFVSDSSATSDTMLRLLHSGPCIKVLIPNLSIKIHEALAMMK